jgi:hypothetical protein
MNIDIFDNELSNMDEWSHDEVRDHIGITIGSGPGTFENMTIYKYQNDINQEPAINIMGLLAQSLAQRTIQPDVYASNIFYDIDCAKTYRAIYEYIPDIISYLQPYCDTYIMLFQYNDSYRKSSMEDRLYICLTSENNIIIRRCTYIERFDRLTTYELMMSSEGWPYRYVQSECYETDPTIQSCSIDLDVDTLATLEQECGGYMLSIIIQYLVGKYQYNDAIRMVLDQCY